MDSKKAQGFIEFIIVTFIFVIVVTALFLFYIDKMPSRYGGIKEQVACSRAELLADALFNYAGKPTDWKRDNITLPGLSNMADRGSTDYFRWQNASEMGFYEIVNRTDLNYSFYTYFKIYAFNLSQDDVRAGDTSLARVFLIRDASQSNLTVYAISNLSTSAGRLDLKLFFPFVNITITNCSEGGTDGVGAGDITNNYSRDNGTEIQLSWSFANEVDCQQFEISPKLPYLIYVKDAKLVNQTGSEIYPIYLGNHTNLTMSVGSEAYRTAEKTYCSLERKGLVRNTNLGAGNETFGAYYYVTAW